MIRMACELNRVLQCLVWKSREQHIISLVSIGQQTMHGFSVRKP
jgi:hypothetical protein